MYNLTKAKLKARLYTVAMTLLLLVGLVSAVVTIHLTVELAFYVRSLF